MRPIPHASSPSRRRTLLVSAALLAAAASWQDPERPPPVPQPPAGATPLPPVRDAPRTAVEREDLLQEFAPRHPIEGTYALRAFVDGAVVAAARGYLMIGRRHVSIHLHSDRGDAPPAVQSAFRSYELDDDRLVMTSLLGLRNELDGDIVLERAGAMRSARYRLMGSKLSLQLGGGRALEFDRIE